MYSIPCCARPHARRPKTTRCSVDRRQSRGSHQASWRTDKAQSEADRHDNGLRFSLCVGMAGSAGQAVITELTSKAREVAESGTVSVHFALAKEIKNAD
jgi:hypothetical protein